jgi:predicted ATP-dependent endonuclease of OLD family
MEKQPVDNQSEERKSSDKIIFTIENYKSIEKVSLTLSDVTVLIGRNNSGKTNIMQAIVKAFDGQSIDEKDLRDKNNPCIVTVDYRGEKNTLEAKAPKYKFGKHNLPFNILYLPAIPVTKDVNVNQTTTVFGQLFRELNLENKKEIKDVIDQARKQIDKLDTETTNVISDYLSKNLIKQGLNIDKVRYESGEVESDTFLKSRKLMVDEIGVPCNLEWQEMGHGTQRMIIMYMFKHLAEIRKQKAKDSKDFLLFVEEPEIFMHPQQQLLFADDIYKPEYRAGVKLIISTHSPYFIDDNHLDGLKIVQKIRNDKSIRTTLVNEGKRLDKYSQELSTEPDNYLDKLLRNFHRNPIMKSMFFAKVVLIVEGDAEEILIPELLKYYDQEKDDIIRKNQITILNTRGNSSIDSYVKVLKDYQIPFIVAMDDDRYKVMNKKQEKKANEADAIIDKLNAEHVTESDNNLCIISGDFCKRIGVDISDDNGSKIGYIFDKLITSSIEGILGNINNKQDKECIEKYISTIRDRIEAKLEESNSPL